MLFTIQLSPIINGLQHLQLNNIIILNIKISFTDGSVNIFLKDIRMLQWSRELQLQKTHANRKSSSKLRKRFHHLTDSTCAANTPNQGLNWDLLCGGGSMVWSLYIYIYIYIFSNLADTSIQSDLQVRTMEIYSLCIMCVCVFLQTGFILMQYPHRFSISSDIGYKSAWFSYFTFYRGHFATNLINLHFKFLHLIYKFNYNNVIVVIYVIKLNNVN